MEQGGAWRWGIELLWNYLKPHVRKPGYPTILRAKFHDIANEVLAEFDSVFQKIITLTHTANIFTISWTRDLHSLHTPSCKIRGHCEHREWQFIREWLFHCNANRGAAGDFSHFVLPCLGCGTYGRSCRKDYSQWIEVIQTRARGTDG